MQGWRCVRHQSQQAGGKRKTGVGVGSALLIGASGVSVGVMGVVGYAAWSEDTRKVRSGHGASLLH